MTKPPQLLPQLTIDLPPFQRRPAPRRSPLSSHPEIAPFVIRIDGDCRAMVCAAQNDLARHLLTKPSHLSEPGCFGYSGGKCGSTQRRVGKLQGAVGHAKRARQG